MKKALPIVAIIAIAAAGFFFLRGGKKDGGETETAAPADNTRAPGTRQKPASETESTDGQDAERGPGDSSVLQEDDPEGELRLEGQVVDDTEDPVIGAVVVLDSNPPRRTTTEKDGSFHFDKLVGREYNLIARADQGVAGPVAARLTRDSEPVILRLGPARSVTIKVVDASDKSPIAGATVELRDVDTQSTTTDDTGTAVIRPVVPDFYSVVAHARGYAKQHTWLRVAAGADSSNTVLALRPGAPVSGRVLAPDGAPIAGASVLYTGASNWAQRAHPRHDAAITDDNGGFRFDALPEGTFRFTARDDKHAPGSSELVTLDGRTEVDNVIISMQTAAVVRGRVTSVDGTPAASARVRVIVQAEGFFERGPTRQAYTDDSGSFEIQGLPRKPLQFVALHESGSSETVDVPMENPPHEREITLVLENTEAISGVVVDSTGEPIEGAQVSAVPDFTGRAGRPGGRGRRFNSSWRLRGFSQELTDAGGRFAIRGLESGAYEVRAQPPGSSTMRGGFLREPTLARTGDTDVRIVLEADGGIKGTLVFDSGGPPELFTVGVGGFGGGTPFSTTDGSFELGDLPPQTYTVTFRGAGFTSKQVANVVIESGKVKDMGTITVIRGRTISGRVTRDGRPVAEADVRAGSVLFGDGSSISARFGGPPGASAAKEGVTDENGEFIISGLGRSEIAIVADHPTHGRSQAIQLAASPESTSGLELALLDVGALEGKAMNGAEPAASVAIGVQSQPAYNAQFGVNTGEDGAYRFDRLAPGKYKISALLGSPFTGMRFHSEQVEVLANQTTTKDLGVKAGHVTVTVTLKPKNTDATNFAYVRLAPGSLAATNANQLEQTISRIAEGYSGFSLSFNGNPATMSDVPAGSYTVCGVVYPKELDARDTMEYSEREGDRLPASCQPLVVTETPEAQSVTLEVDVPAFIPPSGDGT